MGEVKFEKVTKYKNTDFELPVRKTEFSAGYDFVVPEDMIIPSHYAQISKMLFKHLGSKEFLEGMEDLKVVETLMKVGESSGTLTDAAKIRVFGELSKHAPELLEYLKTNLTLDLDQIKSLTKDTDTRMTLVPTGVKAKLKENQKLELLIRSSTPLGAYLLMANSVGLIDADYYNNVDNEGHIYFQLMNLSPFNIKLKKGDVIGQGIISSYEKTTQDLTVEERVGGFGSSN